MYKIIAVCLIFFLQISNIYSLSAIAALFSGTASFFSGSSGKSGRNYMLQTIYFSASKESNDGVATKIHLVAVYDEELASDLIERTAREYFSMVDDLRRDYAGKIAILEWEIPAESRVYNKVQLQKILKKAKPKLMLIFADMRNKNDSQRYPIPETAKNLRVIIEAKALAFGRRSKKKNNSSQSSGNMKNRIRGRLKKNSNSNSRTNSSNQGYFGRANNFPSNSSNGFSNNPYNGFSNNYSNNSYNEVSNNSSNMGNEYNGY